MRIIHTADWHLGQKFKDNLDRREEHEHFLNWLLQTIETERSDVLIIAGDIFDSANPPSYAQQQYYSFLARLYAQGICKDIVITSGNHDSPDRLNAPKELLKVLNVHVVGTIGDADSKGYIPLPLNSEQPEVIIAAVPFLRDQDILRNIDRESIDSREERVRRAISTQYHQAWNAVSHYKDQGLPIIATGHLFASGCEASPDSERIIHIGTLAQIGASDFPENFDYIALGHLHRAQTVAGRNHIRYCGSPIPLSFSERDYRHQIVMLEVTGSQLQIRSIEIPVLRQLKRFEGSADEVREKLAAFELPANQLTAWGEVRIESNISPVLVGEQIRDMAGDYQHKIRIVDYRIFKPASAEAALSGKQHIEALDELQPLEVFSRLLDAHQVTDSRAVLLQTFAELLGEEEDEDEN